MKTNAVIGRFKTYGGFDSFEGDLLMIDVALWPINKLQCSLNLQLDLAHLKPPLSQSYTRGQNCLYPSFNERQIHNGHRNNLNLTKVIINKNDKNEQIKVRH